jgi:hypothetical protein
LSRSPGNPGCCNKYVAPHTHKYGVSVGKGVCREDLFLLLFVSLSHPSRIDLALLVIHLMS